MPAEKNQDEWTDDEEEPLPHAQAWEVGRRLVLPGDEYPDAPCTELDGRGWEVEVMKYNRREAKVRVSFVHATDEDGRRYAPMWLMSELSALLASLLAHSSHSRLLSLMQMRRPSHTRVLPRSSL